MKVCIITVGNEILKGRTVNTNASHIGRILTYAGHDVVCGLTVPDRLDDIVWAFKTAVEKCDLIISSGGLGPTYDDMTLEGVSLALKLPLEINADAESMIRKKYESMNVEVTGSRIKMAKLPRGSTPLENNVGTAPGVSINFNGARAIILPGVPAEMKAILETVALQLKSNDRYYYEESITVKGIMESEMAPVINALVKKNGGSVYIKSHPRKAEDKSPELEIEISGSSAIEKEAIGAVKRALDDIKVEADKLRKKGKKSGETRYH